MKICLVKGSMGTGGIGQNYINLATSFISMGHYVDIFFLKRDETKKDLLPDKANIYYGGNSVKYGINKFVKYLKKNKPDLVISSHTHINVLSTVCIRLLKINTKIFITIHTNQSVENLSLKSKTKILWLFLEKIIVRYVDEVIAVSEGVAKDFEMRNNLKYNSVKVIGNPININKISVYDNKKSNKINKDKKNIPVLIGVGRLCEQKNFALLIDSFYLLLNEYDSRLIILGDGEEKYELLNKIERYNIKDKIAMPGFVNDPYAYISYSDMLVLSSKWEGFGNVIIEALALGKKVVSTNCPSGPSEILQYGKFGTIVNSYIANDFKNAIINELNTSRDQNILKERAFDYASDKIANKYLSLY